ncbi:MAG: PAS domain S-box protein [Bacteroidetes bacterium]|nr:PAS domain S-box protein [Bacteroidota bacterium]
MRNIKILHLEDVSSDAFLLKNQLSKSNLNFEILVVDTKDKFIKELRDFKPDIILSDHSLPSFDSQEALTILKATGLAIPFILVTAAMPDEVAVDLIKKGADDYILKDRLSRLPSAILNAIEKFRLQREQKEFHDKTVRNEKYFRALIENTGEGIAILSKEGKPFYVSPSIKNILGFTIEEGMQLELIKLAHPEDAPVLLDVMTRAMNAPGIPISGIPVRMRHKNGTWRWMDGVLTNMLHDPEINGIVDNYRDVTERVLADKVLKDSEEKYRSFFENNMDGILLTVADGKILAANPAACRMFQMTEEEICKKGRFGLVDSSDERVQQAIEERKKYSKARGEITLIRKNGTRFPCEISSTVFLDSNGEERTSMIIRDLTDTKRSESAISELQTNLQSIFDNTSEGFILTDTSGIVKAFNNKAKDIVLNNVETQINIGTSVFDYIHEDRRENYKIVVSKVLSGQTINYDHCYKKEDGRVTWINFSIDPVFNSGNIEGVCIRGTDITERKTAEEQQALLVSIVNSTDDAVITKNLGGIITSWNPGAEKMFGYSAKEILGKNISLLSPPNLEQKEKFILEKLKKGEAVEHYETERQRKDGQIIYVSLTISPIRDTAGNIIGASKIARDITDKRASDEKIKKNAKYLSEAQRLAKMGSWNFDFKKDTLTWSEELYNVFDTDKETFIETHGSFLHLVDPIHRERTLATSKNTQATGEPFEIEYNITTARGEHRVIQERGYGEKDKQGNVIRLFGTAQDITERKTAENKLNEASIKLERAVNDLNKIFDSSLDVICTINAKGEFVKVSAASEDLWGYKPADLIGTRYIDLVYFEDIDITTKEAEEIISGIQVTDFENRYVHKNGKLIPLLWSVNWDEKLQIMFCIAKDVTEKKRLEKALLNERDQFFEMFAKAPSAIGMLKGADHVFVMANPLYLISTGKQDVIGKTVAEVFPEVKEQGFIEILDHVYHTGEPFTGNELLAQVDIKGNGEMTDLYMNLIYQAYRNGEGEIEGVFFFINDITEQILSRKAIEKSERFFKGVIENSADMILIFAPDGKMIYASPAISKIFCYTNEECLSLNIADIVHPDDALIMQEFVMKIMKHPGVPMECPLIRDRKKDGTYIWVEGTLTNHLETEGINAIVANFRDVTERRKAENILKANEEFNRTILESSPDCMKVIDNEGRLQFMNTNGCKLMEVEDFNILKNKYWWDLWGDENKQVVKASIKKSLEGKSARFEAFSPTLKGNGKWWDVMISPAAKTADGTNQIISVSRDITEKKKSEEENRFKANLLNTIGQAAIATDLDGVVNYWNKAAENIFGWASEAAIGKNIAKLTRPQTTKKEASEIMEDIRKGRTWSGEFRMQRKDGSDFPALVTDSPIYDEKNELTGLISILSDITEKKKLEELFIKASTLALIGSYEIDLVANTLYWSSITKQIHEVEESFIPEVSTAINFCKEGISRQSITESLQKTIEEGVSFDVELQIITAKDNERWIRALGEGEFLNGKCLKVHGSFQDITLRKLEQQQKEKMTGDIVQRNKNLEQFSYIVSHNLRSPVANILGLTNLLKSGKITAGTMKRCIEGLILASTKLDEVIRDLNEILEVKQNITEKKEWVDLTNLASDILSNIQALILKENATIFLDFSEVPSLLTIKGYLHSIFYNLISNSIKYRQNHIAPVIEVKSQVIDNKIILLFKDNGLGIDLEKQSDKLFGLYKRFHANNAEGKGMGLYMVKVQVEAIGGTISVKSEVNKGTEFRIEFPI